MKDIEKLISKVDELLKKMESFNKPYFVSTNLKRDIKDIKDIKRGEIIPVHNSSFKTSSKNIISRVIAGIIAAFLIGALTWVGDLLYEAPSPTQQKVIQKMALQIREYPVLHASNL